MECSPGTRPAAKYSAANAIAAVDITPLSSSQAIAPFAARTVNRSWGQARNRAASDRQHPRFLRALSRFIDGDGDLEFIATARASIAANVDLLLDVLLAHRSEIAHELPERALRFAILNATCSIETYALDPSSIWHIEPCVSAEELTDNLVHSFLAYLTKPGPSHGTRGDV